MNKLSGLCVLTVGLTLAACSGAEKKQQEGSAAADPAPATGGPASPAKPTESALTAPPTVAPNALPSAPVPVPSADNSGAGVCGDTNAGLPMCPLQKWMEDHLAAAMEQRDTARIAAALAKIPDLAPDASWSSGEPSWAAIANAGAEKARAGDFDGAKASCKGCHKAFRERYRREYRTRPVPGA